MLQVSKSSGLLIVSVAAVVLAVAAAIAATCNSSAPSSTETPVPSPTTTPALYPYTVTGDDDVEVVFDAPPEAHGGVRQPRRWRCCSPSARGIA